MIIQKQRSLEAQCSTGQLEFYFKVVMFWVLCRMRYGWERYKQPFFLGPLFTWCHASQLFFSLILLLLFVSICIIKSLTASSHGFNLQMEFLSQEWSAEVLWHLKAPLPHVGVTAALISKRDAVEPQSAMFRTQMRPTLSWIYLYPTGGVFLVGSMFKNETK